MKEAELRKYATCSLCHCKILQAGIPLFWRVTIERFGIDLRAMQRQIGLGMMLNPQLAMVMGPDEDLAGPMMDKVVLTVCEECACSREIIHIVALAELKGGNAP